MLNLSQRIQKALKSGNVWIVIMMTIGTLLSIVYKFQNTTYVYEGPAYKPNFHPFLQAAAMFVGQFISLPLFFLLRKLNPEKYEEKERVAVKQGKKLNINKFLFLVPSFFDLISSTMNYIALNFISTSAYQLMKGGTIITTFIFSILFFKKPMLRTQSTGSFLAFLGILITGFANIMFTNQSSSSSSFWLEIVGYILMLVSLFTHGLFFVFQQKILKDYHVEPMEMVGYEGLFGLLMYIIFIPILCYIPCTFGPNACVYSRQGFMYLEGWTVFIDELNQNSTLLFLLIFVILSLFAFNVAGVTVTKYINALARAIANSVKSVFVWILSLIVTLTFGRSRPNMRWEKLGLQLIIFQSLGFISMILGNLIYNNVLKFEWLQNKKSVDQEQKKEVSEINEDLLEKGQQAKAN